MASDIKIRFKSFLPGAGRDGDGKPDQRKQEVRGQIDVTSYTRGGENLRPQDLGLTSIDHLKLSLEEPFTNPNPSAFNRVVDWSKSAFQFYVVNFYNSEGREDAVEIASGTALKLTFSAFGRSSDTVRAL